MKEDLFIKESVIIPIHELEISASRSGGPGGQHVNKTSSKIIIRWNVKNSNALTEEQKILLLNKLQSQLTKDGDLIVSSSESRSQIQNRKIAIQYLIKIIKDALYVPKKRKKTKIPTVIKESILQKKKKRSEIKKFRRKKIIEE